MVPHDRYDKDYYSQSSADDPTGPTTGDEYIVRGGSWGNWSHNARSAKRNMAPPSTCNVNLGFRVARSQ